MMTVFDKLKDDRGNPSKICSPRKASIESGYAKEFIANRDETGRFWSTFLFTGFFFASFMHIWFWFSINSGSTPFFTPLSLSIFAFSFLFYGGAMGAVIKLYGWRSSTHARQALLRAGLCAGCGYSICELQPEADGCTVCPECGGAWRLKP